MALKAHCITPHEKNRRDAYLAANWQLDGAKYLYFILDDHIVAHCNYINNDNQTGVMDLETFNEGVKYARENYMIPVYLGDPYPYISTRAEKYKLHIRIDYLSDNFEDTNEMQYFIPIIDSGNYTIIRKMYESCILRLTSESVPITREIIDRIADYVKRINVIKPDQQYWDDNTISEYKTQLDSIAPNVKKKINLFNDGDYLFCKAGSSEFAYAPDGNFYICPAFYFNGAKSIGNPFDSISVPDGDLFTERKSVQCNECSIKHCQRCYYQNYTAHGMVNYPSKKQCSISKLESRLLLQDNKLNEGISNSMILEGDN